MRHIKRSDLLGLLPSDWSAEATAALEKLKTLPVDERSAFINERAELWSKVKKFLVQLSHGKCWYSEARIAPTELEIDHFRPKGRVAQASPPHRGYWWLAFEWQNFRLAYSLINKRRRDWRDDDVQGKGSFFPLLDETKRVPDTTPASIGNEKPLLLDPCDGADVQLLDYAVEDGLVLPKEGRPVQRQRAERSIELYHLNEGTLIRDRHELYVAIKYLVGQVERLLTEEDLRQLTPKEEEEYDDLINQIADQINSASRFSTFARACLRQLGDRGWNTELLART